MKKQFLILALAPVIFACGAADEPATDAGTATPAAVEANETVTTPEAVTPVAVSNTQTKFAENISCADIADRIANGEVKVLDVRTPAEVAEGKIANSVHINIHDADFEARLNELNKDDVWVVYCKAGGRSSQAMAYMVRNNFNYVYNLDGGITAWQGGGHPIEK